MLNPNMPLMAVCEWCFQGKADFTTYRSAINFVMSEMLFKKLKPDSEQEFVKPLQEDKVKLFQSISWSQRTVAVQINESNTK